MMEFINSVAPYVYVFLIVGSVFFGVSLAVNYWLSITIKKVRKETDKNYVKSLSKAERENVNIAINNAKINYSSWQLQNAKNNKIKLKNKIKKAFKLKEKPLYNEVNVKDIFIGLLKEVYRPFKDCNATENGYLSFSKNQIFSILNKLTLRVDEILTKSGASWLKNVKIALIVSGIEIYSNYKSFLGKIWVVVVFKFIDFFMWFLKIFSPVSVSKYFIKNLTNQNLSLLISDTLVEIIAKELAVMYKEMSFVNDMAVKSVKIEHN